MSWMESERKVRSRTISFHGYDVIERTLLNGTGAQNCRLVWCVISGTFLHVGIGHFNQPHIKSKQNLA